MNETIINVTQPLDPGYLMSLASPKQISPSSTLIITINIEPAIGIDWLYFWDIEYSPGNFSQTDKDRCNEFFAKFKTLNSKLRAISIPSSYLLPNSELKVLTYAKSYNFQVLLSSKVDVKITNNLPLVEFRYIFLILIFLLNAFS